MLCSHPFIVLMYSMHSASVQAFTSTSIKNTYVSAENERNSDRIGVDLVWRGLCGDLSSWCCRVAIVVLWLDTVHMTDMQTHNNHDWQTNAVVVNLKTQYLDLKYTHDMTDMTSDTDHFDAASVCMALTGLDRGGQSRLTACLLCRQDSDCRLHMTQLTWHHRPITSTPRLSVGLDGSWSGKVQWPTWSWLRSYSAGRTRIVAYTWHDWHDNMFLWCTYPLRLCVVQRISFMCRLL